MTHPVEVWRYQVGGNLSSDLVYGVAVTTDNSAFLLGTKEYYYGTSGFDFAAVKIDAVDGELLWEWKEGSEGDDVLFSAAAVSDGVVGSGYFNGTWETRTTAGGADFAVLKLYSNGTVAWRWHEGTEEDDILFGAAQTVDGHVVVAGYTLGSWSDTNNNFVNVAAAKLNADDGEVMWRYQAGTTVNNQSYVEAAVGRGDGSVVLGGSTFQSFQTTSGEDYWGTDFLTIALDEDGNELWRWQDGPGTGNNHVFGVAAFDDGSILLAGKTEGSWAIDNLGYGDFALTKLNASGHLEWSWQEGTAFDDEFAGVAIGTDGSVILSGYTYGSWAASRAGTEYNRDFVAMSITAEGDVLWKYQAGTTLDDDFNDVTVRPDGLIMLGGWTDGHWNVSDTSDLFRDFAAVLLNTTTFLSSAPFSTPSPASSATPSPILPPTRFPTPTPTRFPTPYPTPSQSSISPLRHSAPTNNSTNVATGSNSEARVGLIVGSLVGGLAIVAMLITCSFCWWRRNKRPKAFSHPAPSALPAAHTPVVVKGSDRNIPGANSSANAPPPAYVDLPPAYKDLPPAYSSVA